MANLKYKATGRYDFGWTDPQSVFGPAPVKGEGQAVFYGDPLLPLIATNDHEIEVDLDGTE